MKAQNYRAGVYINSKYGLLARTVTVVTVTVTVTVIVMVTVTLVNCGLNSD